MRTGTSVFVGGDAWVADADTDANAPSGGLDREDVVMKRKVEVEEWRRRKVMRGRESHGQCFYVSLRAKMCRCDISSVEEKGSSTLMGKPYFL
jgi:hypothetical protein